MPVLKTKGLKLMAAILAAMFVAACQSMSMDEYLKKADSCITHGKPKDAISYLEKAERRYPKDGRAAGVILRIARLYEIFLRNEDKAMHTLGRVIEKYPNSVAAAIAREHRANIYQRIKHYDAAISDLSVLMRMNPRNAEKYSLMLANVYMAAKDYGQARVELIKIIRDKKTSEQVLEQSAFAYSESLFLQGKSNEASGWYQAFIREFPRSKLIPEAKVHLAACLEESGKLGAAKTVMDSAKGYPNKNVITIHLKSMEKSGAPTSKRGPVASAQKPKKRS